MPRKPIKFNLDFMRKDIFSRFTVKQFDDVTFTITPKMDNEPYNVDNMTGVIYVGVNGEMFKQDTNITVSSNSIVVTLDKNMLNKDGRVYAEIELTDSIGTVTSSSFIFDIDRKIGEGANIPGQIDGFVAKYEKLTTEFKQQFQDSLNDVNNRFNILTSSQQQDSEVILARKGETSLKVKIDKIDEQFNTIESDYAKKTEIGSPFIATSTTEMIDTTKVYVNTTDGNWYSWDGSEWVAGGIYNSQGIADKSITPTKTSFITTSSNIINPTHITKNKAYEMNYNVSTKDSIIDSSSLSIFTEDILVENGDVIYSNLGGRVLWYKEDGVYHGNGEFKLDEGLGIYTATVNGTSRTTYAKIQCYTSELNLNYWYACKKENFTSVSEYNKNILSEDIEILEYDRVLNDIENLKQINDILLNDATLKIRSPKTLYFKKGDTKHYSVKNILSSEMIDRYYLKSSSIWYDRYKKIKVQENGGTFDWYIYDALTNTKKNTIKTNFKCIDYTTKNIDTPINVMMIGDSYTDSGFLPAEIKRQLVHEMNFSNINFVGTREDTIEIGTETITVKNEGRGGYSLNDYLKTTNEGGRGTTYPNPFLNNGVVSIKNYANKNSLGNIDCFIIELGVNNLVGYPKEGDNTPILTVNKAKEFIDLIHSEYPNSKILLIGLALVTDLNDGINATYHNSRALELNELYEQLSLHEDYSSFLTYCDIATTFDIDNAFKMENVKPYRNADFTILKQLDWLHPSNSGYSMIADSIVPAILDII